MQVDGISPDRTCHVAISALVLAADPTRRTAVSISVGSLLTDRCEVEPHIVEAVLNHIGGHKAVVAGVYNKAKYDRAVRYVLAGK
jgi:hypothetical protein